MRRRGFALLAVLWVMVGLSVLALGASLAGREAVGTARNRLTMTRLGWRAEGCAERVRAAVAGALGGRAGVAADEAWRELDALVPADGGGDPACAVALRPAGDVLDVNGAGADELRRLFLAIGTAAPRADSLADAILDWRDPDDVPRPAGAERSWYEERGRPRPRGGPFADPREMRRVRGLEDAPWLDTLMGIEPGRVLLDRAPLAVIAALPGITPEALARIAERRERGVRVGGLMALAGALSPESRASLVGHFAELQRRVAEEPDAWLLTVRASADEGWPAAAVELRLERVGARAATVRRRTW